MRAPIFVAILNFAAFAQTASFTVVSSANYRPAVAPDSLATIFGSGLAQGTASAQLDSNGQLPKQLAGVTVQVNGEAAGLIYVSAGQINFVVPTDIPSGTADVFAKSGIMSGSHASVQVSNTAPGLFSLDASGSGPGAILNGVTYARAPFLVETQANPGVDKRTRLALYGTGFRWAGNASHDTTVTNVAAQVTAQALVNSGPNVQLQVEYAGVEYAGAAPGYFGLDQINIVLPADLDGQGAVPVAITVENGSSNAVTFEMGSLPANQIALSGLTLDQSYVIAGGPVMATVTLNARARGTGLIVAVRSNNPSVQPPSSVTIPSGQTSMQFAVPTMAVSNAQTVTLTAQAGSATQTATLEVDPASTVRLTSLAFASSSVQGGQSVPLTATLSGAAPAGGVSIALQSANSVVTIPAALKIPFGQTSGAISVSTPVVSTTQSASITGVYGHDSLTTTLNINPPFTLTLASSAVTGGGSVGGSISLAQPAPSGGRTILLKSSDISAETASQAIVNTGQSSATFTVTTTSVTTSRSVAISATSPAFPGVTETATLAVNAASTPLVSSLTISPSTVSGGSTATGAVTLSAAAPNGGLVVNLKTDSPFYAQIPQFVTIAGGAASATFQISTTMVPSTQVVTLTASYGGLSKTATLTVK